MFLPSFELTSKPFSKCFTAFHAKWERIRLTFMNFQTDVLYPNYANRVSTGRFHRRSFYFSEILMFTEVCLVSELFAQCGTLIYRDKRNKPVKEQTNGFCNCWYPDQRAYPLVY